MKSVAMTKLAASALVLGVATVGCSPAGLAMRPGSASDLLGGKQAQEAAGRAQRALDRGRALEAVGFAEEAVATMPRDASYRLLLAQSYLSAGRLSSAETSFADTLTLDPERERAALNLALVQTALGKRTDAMRTLADYRDKLPAADFGLAVALAGDPASGVGILETAARATDASAKTRQNLALAYAMAGQWAKARATAQQDLDPTVADKRVLGWASFTSPANSWDQVASLLGVTPVEDAGQPTRLALAPGKAPLDTARAASTDGSVTIALAEPTPPPMATAAAFEVPPVMQASVAQAPIERPAAVQAPIDMLADTSVEPGPVPAFETPVVVAPRVRAMRSPMKLAAGPALRLRPAAPQLRLAGGSFVVQLGAFSSATVAQRAWGRYAARSGLANYQPMSGTARVGDASLVRLAVSGFATRTDADRVCGRVRASGGACFVRVRSDDATASWFKRGQPVRMASR